MAALLVVGLAAVLAAERAQGQRPGSTSLFVRWRTWAVIAPVALLPVWTTLSTAALVAALSAQAVREYCRLGSVHDTARWLPIAAAAATPAAILADVITVAVALLLGVAAVAIWRDDAARGQHELLSTVFA